MSTETFDEKMKEVLELMERAKTTKLNVSFFGGEPMLNWELIEHATKELRTKYSEICNQIIIISNMTMIDEEKIKFIKKWNLGISWSFDGMGSNDSRPLLPMMENTNKDGIQYNGILDLYKDKMHLIKEVTHGGCKVMIFPGNVDKMVENYDFFLEYGINSPDYSIVRDDIWTKDDIIHFRNELIKLADKYIETVKKGKYTTIGLFQLHLLDAVGGHLLGKRTFSCFAGVNGGVLMPSGDFYPCARFASKKLMKIDEEYSFQYWRKELNTHDYDKCKSCDMFQVCNMGCTYSQILNDNKPLDSICELFHIIEEQTHRIVDELKDDPTFIQIVGNSLKRLKV
jgi:uncharacterized protein